MQKEILLQTIGEQVAVQGFLLASKNPTHTVISPTDQLDLLKKIDCAIQQNERSECINQHLKQYKDIYQGQQMICNMDDGVEKNAAGMFFYLPALPNDLTLDQDFSAQPPHEDHRALVEIDVAPLVERLTDGPKHGLHGHDEQQARFHLKRACRNAAFIPKLGFFARQPSDQNTDEEEQQPRIHLKRASRSAAFIPKSGLIAREPSDQNTDEEEPRQRSAKRRPRIEELSETDKSRVRDQNRLSARNARDRNKAAVVSLIESANHLEKQNKSLRTEITFLTGKLRTLKGIHQRAMGANRHATISPLEGKTAYDLVTMQP